MVNTCNLILIAITYDLSILIVRLGKLIQQTYSNNQTDKKQVLIILLLC